MVANLDLSSIWEPEDSGLQLKLHQNSPEGMWKQMARPRPRGLLVISVLVTSFPSEAKADAAGCTLRATALWDKIWGAGLVAKSFCCCPLHFSFLSLNEGIVLFY